MAVTAVREEIPSEFEGAPVVGMKYEVRGISGGLQDPASFNPVHFARGEEGYLVLKFVHRSPRFDPADKEDPAGDAVRVQILDVLEGTIVDESVVLDAMKRQRSINEEGRRRLEAEQGIHHLNFGSSDDEAFALAQEHANGEHKQPIAECPVCAASAGDEESEPAVMVRQHLAGVHADGLRPGCVMCDQEQRAEAKGD